MPQAVILKENNETYRARRYVDLKADFAFKRMFAQENGETVRVAFLNALLAASGHHLEITSATILNTDMEREHRNGKKAVLDLLARTNDGTLVHIELQLLGSPHLANRHLYYWSRIYAMQLEKSEAYSKLHRTISILISNTDLLPQTAGYHSCFRLYEADEHFLLTDQLEIHVIELQKLLKAALAGSVNPWSEPEIRWLLMLAAVQGEQVQTNLMKELEAIAMSADVELFKAFERWEEMSRDPKIWATYEMWRKARLDEASEQADREAEKAEKERLRLEKQQLETEKQRLASETQSLKSETQRLELERQSLKSETQRLELERQSLKSETSELKQRLLKTGKELLSSGIALSEVVRITGLTEEELL